MDAIGSWCSVVAVRQCTRNGVHIGSMCCLQRREAAKVLHRHVSQSINQHDGNFGCHCVLHGSTQ